MSCQAPPFWNLVAGSTFPAEKGVGGGGGGGAHNAAQEPLKNPEFQQRKTSFRG